MSKKRGSEALIAAFTEEGVRYIFGNPGSTEVQWLELLPLYPDLRYILTLHENIAVGMAEGYALASGQIGVASVHASPGAAHALGNLYNAWVAGSPVVLLIGQVDSRLLIYEPFLASDVTRLVQNYTKWSWEVRCADEIPLAFHRACKIATDPPTGPTAIAVPCQLYDESVTSRPLPTRQTVTRRTGPDPAAVLSIVQQLVKARHPAVLCGPETFHAGAIPELIELVELLALPVYDDIRYSPSFPTTHPLYMGLFDLGNIAEQSDLLLVIGQRAFLERGVEQTLSWPSHLNLIHITSNSHELAKNRPTSVGLLGDPKLCLQAILEVTRSQITPEPPEHIAQRRAQLEQQRREQERHHRQILEQVWDRTPIAPERLAAELRRVAPEESILVVEAVSHHAAFRQYFPVSQPGRFFSNTGGSLGWGLPAALGIKLARPDQPVICVVGDGSFLYYPQALWTAQRYNLPLVVLVCNNRSYLNDKRWLQRRGGPAAQMADYSTVDITEPHVQFSHYARAVGAQAHVVETPSDLTSTLAEAIQSNQTWLLDIAVDPLAANPVV